MKGLIVLLMIFLIGCSKSDILVCNRSYYVQELGHRIDVETKVEFKNKEVDKYVNRFIMNLENEDEETIEMLFESMKSFYKKEEMTNGIIQNFEKGDDYLLYEIIHDMKVYGRGMDDFWGSKEDIRRNLEQDEYICK